MRTLIRWGGAVTEASLVPLAAARMAPVFTTEVRVEVVTARARVPLPRTRVSACAGSDARKYLRRRRDFAGDVLS